MSTSHAAAGSVLGIELPESVRRAAARSASHVCTASMTQHLVGRVQAWLRTAPEREQAADEENPYMMDANDASSRKTSADASVTQAFRCTGALRGAQRYALATVAILAVVHALAQGGGPPLETNQLPSRQPVLLSSSHHAAKTRLWGADVSSQSKAKPQEVADIHENVAEHKPKPSRSIKTMDSLDDSASHSVSRMGRRDGPSVGAKRGPLTDHAVHVDAHAHQVS